MKIILIISIILLASCKKKLEIKGSIDTKVLNAHLDGETISPSKLSDFIDSVSFITIATDSNILIGNIKDVKPFKDFFYILDSKLMSIFKIDKAGNIVQTLSKRGRAPGEYLNIDVFDINPSNGDIHIYDWASKHILIYNIAGKHIKTIPAKDVIRDMAVFPNGEYIFYTPDYMKKNKRGLWRSDSLGNFKEQLIEIDKNFRYGGIHPRYFNRINDHTIGLMGGEDYDRIYHIKEDTIFVKYKLDIDRKLSEEVKKTEVLDPQKFSGQFYTKNNYIETNKVLMVEVTDFQKQVLLLYNKENQKTCQARQSQDLTEDIMTACKSQFSGNGIMIGIIEVGQILNNTYLHEMFPTIDAESNPILSIMYTN